MNISESGKSSQVISASDIIKKLPFIARKIPGMLKGCYFSTLIPAGKPLTVADLIARHAEKYGDRTAIYFNDQTITYRQLNNWANQYAHYYQTQGLIRGEVIAINIENRPELIAALAGANKLGIAAAMINTSQKGQALAHSINLLEPKLVVLGEEQLEKFESARGDIALACQQKLLIIPDTDTLNMGNNTFSVPEGYVNLAAASALCPKTNPQLKDRPQAGDIAVYLFTSGTTGMPKAAPSSHQKWFKVLGAVGQMSLDMRPDDVIYITLPLYHGTGLLVCWGAALAGGSAIALRRKFSASEFWHDVRKYHATSFGYVGELCRYLLSQPAAANDREHSLVKMVGNGLRPSMWKQFKDRFGISEVVELYGASEGNIGFSNLFNFDDTVGLSPAPFALVKYHQGTRDPVLNKRGYLQKVPKGDPGLLLGKITRTWNFEGYSQHEATEQAIIRNAFRTGDAWFNTGDILKEIGFRHLQFVDRMGDTYRWKGENVSTTEVENVFDKFTEIQETVVYGVGIANTDGKAGMATVVPKSPAQGVHTDQLSAFLKDQLASYAIPVFLRITDAIEKTATFKYRKTDLAEAGFSAASQKDKVYVWLPGTPAYQPLDQKLIQQINTGKIRL
jgi:citronellyl-CoA synthetase